MNTYLPPKKILLIEPPFYSFFNYERWHYPVTLTLVGTYLQRLGHKVKIYDADKPSANCMSLSRCEVRNNYNMYLEALENRSHPIWLEAEETIEKFQPEIVGLTSITAKIDSTDIIAAITRKLFGNKVKIILGGAHAQGMRLMYPDYNFNGYYDEIVTYIPDLINQTPNKELIINFEKYSSKNFSSIMTLSGCPNYCTFCCHSFEKKLTYRNISSIREELEDIRERYGGSEPIYIMDDCFFSNSSRFNEISNIMDELELKFKTGGRIMSLTPQKIETFVKRGGLHISVGVESGSQSTLNRIKKNLKVNEIVKRSKYLNDLGLSWSAFIMVGFPFETVDDLKLTEELVYLIKPTFISINRFVPYPGTEIYKEYFLKSQIRFRDLFQLNRESCVKLSEKNEKYIHQLFCLFEKYNKNNLERNMLNKNYSCAS